jgi:hypothetical protein
MCVVKTCCPYTEAKLVFHHFIFKEINMHYTEVKMKDGRFFGGPIWEWRPREGWFHIAGDNTPDKIYFRDCESAITEPHIIGTKLGDDGKRVAKIEYVDELKRAKDNGWNGT